jgi:5-methylcytosine-specific restriction enzyme B
MRMTSRRGLPLGPLLHAYRAVGLPSIAELHRLPGLGGRFAAVLGASARFLYADYLDKAKGDDFRDAIVRFYKATVALAPHAEAVAARAGFLRHAISHLLNGSDSPARRLAACLSASGAYRVPGLGGSFWSGLLQAQNPGRYPGWTPDIQTGLERLLGRDRHDAPAPAALYGELLDLHARIRATHPEMTSLHIDHFLSLLAHMRGRDIAGGAAGLTACPIAAVIRRMRGRRPLRDRLKERGRDIAGAQDQLQRALEQRDAKMLGDALAVSDPAGASRSALDWGRHAQGILDIAARLWKSEKPLEDLDAIWRERLVASGGLWLAPAILHLRDPQSFGPFSDPHRAGHARLDEGADASDPPCDRYRLYNAVGLWLREQHGLHPMEVPDVFLALGEWSREREDERCFAGFCGDTFAFLAELARNNRRDWMQQQRDRYEFAVRAPLAELCDDLTRRFVGPVLFAAHGWAVDTRRKAGHALTSICKNVFGKSSPYTSTLWITFCPEGSTRASPQLFVRLSPEGLRWGLRLGRSAREHRARLLANLRIHGPAVWKMLRDNGAAEACQVGTADTPNRQTLASADDLVAWAGQRTLEISTGRLAGDTLLSQEHLVGEIILTLDRLLPLFACAVEAEPGPALVRLGGPSADAASPNTFHDQTFLDQAWLRRSIDLLSLKKQLILQGVPGTGKTHVARCLARLLTRGADDAVRLVQFHPAYSYEEFVEGIRVRSISVEGRSDITYPVEDGLLCEFAARAAARPAQPHVLIIDEINRGNLPRIFGELLYLLEYRGQAVELPCSRRAFRLPDNLYLLATMNASDRSIALLDQALRRRFSFLHMEPDAGVLSSWLMTQPLAGGPAMAARVLRLFEQLNAKLRAEAGPGAQVGHSFFMVPHLDEGRLRMIWHHHIRPLLDEVFTGQPGRAAAFDGLLDNETPRPRPSRPARVESL